MADSKKVVIVGAGHNGLVAAGYLARAGLDVEVLERRDVVGGAAVTEEWFPDFHISTCSYICHMLQKKVIDDLELRRYGFYVYSLDPARIFPHPSGNVIRLWHDDARTADEIREFSPHDADAWTEWADFWTRSVRILSDYYLSPPPSLAELSARFKDEGEEELLETLLTVPFRDLIDRYFESDEVRAMVSTGSFDMGDISAPGSAYISALYRYGAYRDDMENYGIVQGGMGAITQSMKGSVEASGAVDQDRRGGQQDPYGGRTSRWGRTLRRRGCSLLTWSCRTPTRSERFWGCWATRSWTKDFVEDVRALKTESASAKLLCSLKELPDFSTYLGTEHDPKELAMVVLCPSIDNPEKAWHDSKNGRIPEVPMIQVQIPSVYDDTIAPDGHHVLSMWVYFLPPHVAEGSWDDSRQQFGEQLIDLVSEYAPNLRDAIEDWTLLTPKDIEDRIGLTDGNIRHIDMVPQQMMSRRPLPGWTDYRTPVRGLYMCGSGTHPGGEVTGAPGHNAANVIMEDLGLGS